MRQSVVDELMAQRDAVLFGTWVQRSPRDVNEACLVQRVKWHPRGYEMSVRLTSRALIRISEARQKLGHLTVTEINSREPFHDYSSVWNDDYATTFNQVVEVLDEAIRIEKGE